MFETASDPLIWEQHPNPLRYQKEVFKKYFDEALESKGALAIIDKNTHQIIGCSRYYNFNHDLSTIMIGYTFLSRSYWGGKFNSELKNLMLNHAFSFVNKVHFLVGKLNIRSQSALQRIGAQFIGEEQTETPNGNGLPPQENFIFEITKKQLRLVEVGIEHAKIVQEIFESSPTYFRRVSGSDPLPDEAIKAFQNIPKKKDLEFKKVSFLIYQGADTIGYTDLLIDYPNIATAYLGLLTKTLYEYFWKKWVSNLMVTAISGNQRMLNLKSHKW
jgi:RimJ/RimL family protein N-acetyltransferase